MFHVHSKDILAFYIITVIPHIMKLMWLIVIFKGWCYCRLSKRFILEEQIYIWSDSKFTSSSYWVDFIDFVWIVMMMFHLVSSQLGRRAMALFFPLSLPHPPPVIRLTSAAPQTLSQKPTVPVRVWELEALQIGSTFLLQASCRKMLPKHCQVSQSFSQSSDLER